MMTFKEFSIANRKRSEDCKGFNHRMDKWSLSEWFIQLTEELGESARVIKKFNKTNKKMGFKGFDIT